MTRRKTVKGSWERNVPNHTTVQLVLCETAALQTPKCAHTNHHALCLSLSHTHTTRCPHVEHMLQSGVHAGVFWWPQRVELGWYTPHVPFNSPTIFPLYSPSAHTDGRAHTKLCTHARRYLISNALGCLVCNFLVKSSLHFSNKRCSVHINVYDPITENSVKFRLGQGCSR